jgi:hypothetical protein
MFKKLCAGALGALLVLGPLVDTYGAEPELMDAPSLPLGTKRLPASAEECEVWRADFHSSQSMQTHDEAGWVADMHPGVIFNVGTEDAIRGLDEVRKVWPSMSGMRRSVVRWRPGLVMIGGDPRVAVSNGPYFFHGRKDGVDKFSVGLYQTVWVKDAGVWRILFDGDASTERDVEDRAAADAWAAEQPMSDCDLAPTKR